MLSVIIFACVLENGVQSCGVTSPPPGFFVVAPDGLFAQDQREECERLADATANFVLNQMLLRNLEPTMVRGVCVDPAA